MYVYVEYFCFCVQVVCAVSSVHPVIIRSAECCIVCNLFMFEFDLIGDQIVLAYCRRSLIIILYVM